MTMVGEVLWRLRRARLPLCVLLVCAVCARPRLRLRARVPVCSLPALWVGGDAIMVVEKKIKKMARMCKYSA